MRGASAPSPRRPRPVSVPGIGDTDFEGIAALGDGPLLPVSDDRIDDDLRSVLPLIAIE